MTRCAHQLCSPLQSIPRLTRQGTVCRRRLHSLRWLVWSSYDCCYTTPASSAFLVVSWTFVSTKVEQWRQGHRLLLRRRVCSSPQRLGAKHSRRYPGCLQSPFTTEWGWHGSVNSTARGIPQVHGVMHLSILGKPPSPDSSHVAQSCRPHCL